MSNRSFWEQEAFPQQYNLVIIGAGITGLSSTLFYKRSHPEASVLVLERGSIPQGASTRNAGFACIGSISEHQADLEQTSEQEVGQRIKRRYKGLELLKSTLGESSIDYERCGGYELFTSQELFEASASHITKFNNWLEDLIGEKNVYSSAELNGYPVIQNRLEGALQPAKMIRSLIQLVQQEGVDIYWNSPVSIIDTQGMIILDDGTQLECPKILVAANGFSQRLLPGLQVQSARGYVFVTHPIEGMSWRGTFHHDRGYIYFRNVGDRLLLGGARNIAEQEENIDQFGINHKIKNHLERFASQTLKLPDGWEIEHEWSGIMGFTETKTPIVKKVDGAVYAAAGLSGMGIAIGMKVGQEASELLGSQ